MSEPDISRYAEMKPAELVKALGTDAKAGDRVHEAIKGALSTVLVKSLTESIDRHERAATKLSLRLFWLNIILGAFTVVGTVLTVISFLKYLAE